ncbi:ion transporter [Candidatus Sumerlaeota bacterium]|nr:ion transporter [Candidatus Sumerlaeota bacterium]
MESLRERIRFWFDDLTTPMGRLVDIAVIALIVLSCFVLVLETYARTPETAARLLLVEHVIIALFIAEYLLRLWAAEHRLRHIFEFYSLIDLAAILPALVTPHLQVVRVFRVLRVLRLLRFVQDRHFFFGSIRQAHLDVLRIAFTIFAIMFVSSGFIWHFEDDANPAIADFGDAFYFTVVTLTTVGFGDITPQTDAAKAVTILMIFAGIIFIPWELRTLIAHATLPTDAQSPDCPRCGLRRHEPSARFCRRCGERLVPGESEIDDPM